MPFSVKSLLNESKISLEKAATDKFGSVVEDFTKNAIGSIFPSSSQSKPASAYDGSWYATSYAAHLAGATSFRPKLKFLFKVQFIFTEEAKRMYPKALGNTALSNQFVFMIKTVDRPKVDFEYEEDVNMYNFRTKVLKKIRHRDLTISFMDDSGNRVFEFFRSLMMVHSPITRTQMDRDNTLKNPSAGLQKLSTSSGMSFAGNQTDSAHRAVVNSSFGNSIEAIRVQQIFVDSSESLDRATKMVSFDFINPRIVSFDLDELSHEANDVNLLTMVFDYDWMEMVDVGVLGTAQTQYGSDVPVLPPAKNITQYAPSDITPNKPNGVSESAAGNGAGPPGFFGALANSAASILGRGASKLTSDLIGRSVRTIAGNGRFATALGGIVSSNLSGPIGGIVSGAAREQLSGIAGTASNILSGTNARALARAVGDASTAGFDEAKSIVSSSSASAASNPAIDNRPRGGT